MQRILKITVLLLLVASTTRAQEVTLEIIRPQTAVTAARPAAKPEAHVGKPGIFVALGGPESIFCAGLSLAADDWFDLAVGLGWAAAAADASSSTYGQTVNFAGKAEIYTPFVRGRVWPLRRHNFIVEGGAALSIYSFSATAAADTHNSMSYSRSATLPIAFAGAGYGFRTHAGFRFSAVAGYMAYFGAADDSSVTSTGIPSAADRAQARAELDKATDAFTTSQPYAEIALGWMF